MFFMSVLGHLQPTNRIFPASGKAILDLNTIEVKTESADHIKTILLLSEIIQAKLNSRWPNRVKSNNIPLLYVSLQGFVRFVYESLSTVWGSFFFFMYSHLGRQSI